MPNDGGERGSEQALLPSQPDLSAMDKGALLLIEAGAVLATSLDPATTMRQVAELTVSAIADLCVIDLCDEDGQIMEVAVACNDERVGRALEEMRRLHPISRDGDHPVAQVIRNGVPQLLDELSQESLRSYASGEEHAKFMIESNYRSAVVAPLAARNHTLGTLSALRLGESEPYTQAESDLIGELARRAALAIDNAQLYSDLRGLEQRLEAILIGLAEAVTVIDRGGKTIFANRAAVELLGASSVEELTRARPGTIMSRFIVLDEDGRELSLDQMPGRKLLRGEQPTPLLVRNIDRASGRERWLMARSSPIPDAETGRVLFAVNVFEDITEVKRTQVAENFLAEASRVLASSLDHQRTLEQIAALAVPRLGDWCTVSLLGERGRIDQVATHHHDPAKLELARRIEAAYPLHRDDPAGVAEILRSGRALFAQVEPDSLASYAKDSEHYGLLAELGVASVIIAPMSAAGRVFGAITLVSDGSGRALTELDVPLIEELGRRAGIAVENSRLYTERTRIASALQQALLPEDLPDLPGAELEALYAAAGELNEVGGDFYDVFEHRDGRWVLAIGDVCGKGPRAAAVTALARHTLRAAAMSGQAPSVMIESVHQALMHQPQGLDMCTLGMILVDLRPPGAHLTIALAGHPQPVLVDGAGTARPVGRPGTLLGVLDPIHIEQAEVHMEAGDTLVLHTDGVTEAGAPSRPLGEEGLRDLCALAPKLGLNDLLRRIEAAAVTHAGGSARDDIALLALRLRSVEERDDK
ncbi:MAG: SpoIIE family protein phosphatase [Solirubrobacteraceae bacterium]